MSYFCRNGVKLILVLTKIEVPEFYTRAHTNIHKENTHIPTSALPYKVYTD